MSFFNKLFAWWVFKKNSGHRGTRMYIIDATGIDGSNGGKRSVSPRDQINALRRLSRFATKEKITVSTILVGEPLRKVGHGGKFDDLTVYYADNAEARAGVVMKLFKTASRSHDAMVICADEDLEEKILAGGGEVMRISTFKKALDSTVGAASEEKKPSHRRQRPRRPSGNRERKPQQQQKKKESGNGVHDLIDLVE